MGVMKSKASKAFQDTVEATFHLRTILKEGTERQILGAVKKIMAAQDGQASKAAEKLRLRCEIIVLTIRLQKLMGYKKSFLHQAIRGFTIKIPNMSLHEKQKIRWRTKRTYFTL